jgi:hypothetical protein
LFCVIVYEIHNVVVISKEIELSQQKLINWHTSVTRRDKGFGQLFIHKLTKTNIKKSSLVSLHFVFSSYKRLFKFIICRIYLHVFPLNKCTLLTKWTENPQ